MSHRAWGLILTAAPCLAAIGCAVIGKAGWAYGLGITGLATAAVTAFGRPDERDEHRARIGTEDT